MTGHPSPLRLGFLASHNGTNMRAVVAACRDGRLAAMPVLLISNNRDSAALQWAADNGVSALHVSAKTAGSDAAADGAIADALRAHKVDVVILAGYMRKLGPQTLAAFPRRILNAHPALLPKFGGQGMYGAHVHTAVLAAGEAETGVTIHLVDEVYDHGAVLAQVPVPVVPGDTVESLAARVQAREQALFPAVLQRIVANEINLDRV